MSIFLFESCLFAQNPSKPKTNIEGSSMTEIQRVRDSVRLFLTAWLVDRDLDTAKSAFGKAAFKNDALLQASCARYIKPDDRGSDIAIKAGIEKFLQDYLPKAPVTSLD